MKTILAVVLSLAAIGASAQVHVNGYTKANGTYVAPHQRTAPDNTINNNYSTKGNINPYTGRAGTVNPDQQPPSQQAAPAYDPIQPMQPTQTVEPIQPFQAVQPSRRSAY